MTKREKAIEFLEEFRKSRPIPKKDNFSNSERGIEFSLGFLHHNTDKEISAGDIAKELRVSTARVAVLLQKMEKQGLINKYQSNLDARKTMVKLTSKGEKIAQDNFEKLINHASKLIEKIGEDKLKEYIDISKKIKEVIEDENI